MNNKKRQNLFSQMMPYLVLLIIISYIFYIYICRFNVVDLLFLIFIILVKCKIIVIKEV